jgi:hypothetical protein
LHPGTGEIETDCEDGGAQINHRGSKPGARFISVIGKPEQQEDETTVTVGESEKQRERERERERRECKRQRYEKGTRMIKNAMECRLK